MAIKHPFVSAIPDDPLAVIAGKVVPQANWNAALNNDGYIYLSNFGVKGDGSTDDTAALNAAFASVIHTGATVIWDVPNFCKTTDTIVVGDKNGGSGAQSSFINIIAPKGNQQAGIFYYGPTDGRPALLFAKNKYFLCRGINVNNQTGSKGTSVGIMLGGAGSGSFGTQTLAATFDACNIVSFHVGITDGNSGAASEILWNSCSLIACDIGFTTNDFNTLDHVFIMLLMSDCGVGLDNGVSEGYRVYGGSATNSTVADFQVGGNGRCLVSGFRSENARRFLYSPSGGGTMTISDCQMRDPIGPWNMAVETLDKMKSLTLSGNQIQGWVQFNTSLPLSLVMFGNNLRPDPSTNLPFVYAGDGGNDGLISVFGNLDGFFFPPYTVADFSGHSKRVSWVAGNNLAIGLNSAPTFVVQDRPYAVAANTLPAPFGADYTSLSFVRQLSEAPTKNAGVPGSNTLVTNASTAAGNPDLHFASIPDWVTPGMFVNATNVPFAAQIASRTSTVVTLSSNVTGGGVANGATITFQTWFGQAQPGQNLRIQGTFATSATLSFTFKRNVTANTGGGASSQLTATSGIFLPSDAGKRVFVAGKGSNGWTDWYGYCLEYVDSTHINIVGATSSGTNFTNTAVTIGADEPDANYMVAGIVGDTTSPESYSVTSKSTTGFTVKSSNGSSTATIVAMIVR